MLNQKVPGSPADATEDRPYEDLPAQAGENDSLREISVVADRHAPETRIVAATQPVIAADEVVRRVIRHWRLAALIVVAVTILAWVAAAVQPKRYHAESIAGVGMINGQMTPSDTLHGVDTLDQRVVVASLAALASSPVVQQQAGARRGEGIEADVLPSTNLFRVQVEGSDAGHAAALANAIPAALDRQAKSIYAVYGVTLMSAAAPPVRPASPRVERFVMAGLLLGIVAGAAAAYVLERFRPSMG